MGSLSAAMQLANGVGVLFFSHTYAWLIRMHPEVSDPSMATSVSVSVSVSVVEFELLGRSLTFIASNVCVMAS